MKKAQRNRGFLLCMLVLSGWLCLNAQISINTDGAAPDSSAILDIKSNSKGILVPKMTKAQRLAIAGPANGLLIFQTDEPSGFYYNSGSAIAPNWKSIIGDLNVASTDKNVALGQWYGDKVQSVSFSYGSVNSLVYAGVNLWASTSFNLIRVILPFGAVDYSIGGTSPYEPLFDGRYIWIAQSNSMYRFDPSLTTPNITIAVGSNPISAAYDGAIVWVANYGSHNVTPIISNTAGTPVSVGFNPVSVIFDGSHIWVSNVGSSSLSKINPVTRSVVATIPLPVAPEGIEFDGTYVWITTGTNGFLYKLNPISGAIVETFSGHYTNKLLFDGTYMWFRNSFFPVDQIHKMSLSGVLLKSYSLSYGVTAMAFDGSYIWVGVSGPFLFKIPKN